MLTISEMRGKNLENKFLPRFFSVRSAQDKCSHYIETLAGAFLRNALTGDKEYSSG